MADGSAVVRVASDEGGLSVTVLALLRPEFAVLDPAGEPGTPRLDIHNPEPTLRNRALKGLRIAERLSRDGEAWQGRIYDPASGRTYRCRLVLAASDYLQVRGYVGLSAFGRTMYWQRLADYSRAVQRMLSALDEGEQAVGQ